jgi:hypothetical protein
MAPRLKSGDDLGIGRGWLAQGRHKQSMALPRSRFDCDARRSRFLNTNPLAKCEVDCLNTGIKKLDLEGPVLQRAFLSDQLIKPGFENFTGAIRRWVSSTISAGGPAVQSHPEANRLAVFRRGHHQVQIATVKSEYNSARWCLRHSTFGIHVPRSTESPVVQAKHCRGL